MSLRQVRAPGRSRQSCVEKESSQGPTRLGRGWGSTKHMTSANGEILSCPSLFSQTQGFRTQLPPLDTEVLTPASLSDSGVQDPTSSYKLRGTDSSLLPQT